MINYYDDTGENTVTHNLNRPYIHNIHKNINNRWFCIIKNKYVA